MMTLDLTKALNSPRQPQLLKRCEGPRYNQPRWMNDGSIAMLQKVDSRWKIMRHSTQSAKSMEIYAPADKVLYSLAYSAKDDLIATVGVNNNDGKHVLDILDNEGELISSAILNRPKSLSPFEFVYPIFDPNRQQLVFSTKKKLFSLSYQGGITEIQAPFYANIYKADFHPNGDKLVATYGTFDTDIAKLSLDTMTGVQPAGGFNQVSQPYPSIARSIFQDKDGLFQPNGDDVAFISERTGSNQVWLADENGARQLTHLDLGTPIDGLSWSTNGEQIMLAANGKLYVVSLDGQMTSLELPVTVTRLFNSTVAGTLLLQASEAPKDKLMLYRAKTGELTALVEASIEWAAINPSGDVIFLDDNRDFWQFKSNNPVKIEGLGGIQGNKRFVMDNNTLYGVDKISQLWRFDMTTGNYRILRKLNQYISYPSDIREQQILVTQVVAAKKEVIEISSNKL